MLKFRGIPAEVFFDALLKAKRSDGDGTSFAPEEEDHETFDDFLMAFHLCLVDVYQEMEHESFFEDRVIEQSEEDFPEWYVRTKIKNINRALRSHGKEELEFWQPEEPVIRTYEDLLASKGFI